MSKLSSSRCQRNGSSAHKRPARKPRSCRAARPTSTRSCEGASRPPSTHPNNTLSNALRSPQRALPPTPSFDVHQQQQPCVYPASFAIWCSPRPCLQWHWSRAVRSSSQHHSHQSRRRFHRCCPIHQWRAIHRSSSPIRRPKKSLPAASSSSRHLSSASCRCLRSAHRLWNGTVSS